MRRYVQLSTSYWIDTADWPKDARYLYLYLWTNDHADGIVGVCHVPDTLSIGETGLTAEELSAAWKWLEEKGKVKRQDGWYWVVDRILHTCLKADGTPNDKMVAGARHRIQDPSFPTEISDAILEAYAYPIGTLPMGTRIKPLQPTDSVSRKPIPIPIPIPDPPSPQEPGSHPAHQKAVAAYELKFGAVPDLGAFGSMLADYGPGCVTQAIAKSKKPAMSYLRAIAKRLFFDGPDEVAQKKETAKERYDRLRNEPNEKEDEG